MWQTVERIRREMRGAPFGARVAPDLVTSPHRPANIVGQKRVILWPVYAIDQLRQEGHAQLIPERIAHDCALDAVRVFSLGR